MDTVEKLRRHILRGDCYEINFCQEFLARDVVTDPIRLYRQLSHLSPTPFGAYYKVKDRFLLCASPERYLSRQGPLLLTQPIKGTSGRDISDPRQDEKSRELLLHSQKERSENVMVVDLVRNDLSKVCLEGSVRVEELFGIYSFPQVHQMISTVTGIPTPDKSWVDMIRATFPMGSMTGAPKRRVLELIETYEKGKRGLFSGAVGYVTPERDFDFNVVIRSILYNHSNRCLSFTVGSGITFYSDPQKEYEECMIKASAIKKVLTG
jgi:para-aminobenzoate synthetase component 1